MTESEAVERIIFYSTNGWRRAKCSCCGEIAKFGRPGNGPAIRWINTSREKWAEDHKCPDM